MNDFYSFRKVVIQEELLFSEMDHFHPAVTTLPLSCHKNTFRHYKLV